MSWAPPTFAAVLVGLGAVVAFTDPGPQPAPAESGALALIEADGPDGADDALRRRIPEPPDPPLLAEMLHGTRWLHGTLASLRAERQAGAAVGLAMASVSNLAVEQPLASLRGSLSPPVAGHLAQGFGPQPRRSTPTQVRHPGLTFEVRSGTEVHAVARGIVVNTARLRGYGGVVVVAHDSGYHTVYAQLAELGVKAGEVVAAGEAVGRTGSASPEGGRQVYFELRHLGDPIDPTGWLAPSP